jgi:hypothetical protein
MMSAGIRFIENIYRIRKWIKEEFKIGKYIDTKSEFNKW